MIDMGDIPSIQRKMSLRGPKSMRKVDGLSLVFIDFYVPTLTTRLSRSPPLSEQLFSRGHTFFMQLASVLNAIVPFAFISSLSQNEGRRHAVYFHKQSGLSKWSPSL
jgi:hypothetical protein